MPDSNGRPNTLEDFLVRHRSGQWFGFDNLNGDDANKTYANLKFLDGGSKPTEKECTDGLTALQTTWDNAKTKQETDESSGKTKFKNLGLSDDEIKALMGK